MLCASFFTGTVMAQPLAFDIPKGDLKAALDAYARQSGVQIIYRVDELQGVVSPGAHGLLEPLAALDAILAHTGFSVRQDRSGALAIVKASTAPRGPAIAGPADQHTQAGTSNGQRRCRFGNDYGHRSDRGFVGDARSDAAQGNSAIGLGHPASGTTTAE
jgi:hypothetical protein